MILVLIIINICVLDGNGGIVSILCGDLLDIIMLFFIKKLGLSYLIFNVNDFLVVNDLDNIKCKYLFFI